MAGAGFHRNAGNDSSDLEAGPTIKTDGDPEQWHYQYNQVNLNALPDIAYEFSFVAWADEAAELPVDFEDIQANAGTEYTEYNRYGVTISPWSANGRSEWVVPITSEAARYTMDVVFDEMVETTVQKVQFMPGLLGIQVFLDSVTLVSVDDLSKLTPHTPVKDITVSGGSSVAVGATLQMSAEVLPAEATYKDVKWSVVPGSGWASIDAAGLLTGDTVGTVLVMASAIDDSRSFGELEVTVGTTGISQSKVNTLKVYPNPALNELNVVLSEGNSTVSIYNSVGMKVDEVIVTGNTHRFDVSSYASGLYFVKTVDSVVKFIK